jgi:hypothetical protein
MQAFCGSRNVLGFQLVGELAQLVEVDARPETERVGFCPRCRATAECRRFPQLGADRPIHHLLERHAQLARPLS